MGERNPGGQEPGKVKTKVGAAGFHSDPFSVFDFGVKHRLFLF